jgi:hypothetical protein
MVETNEQLFEHKKPPRFHILGKAFYGRKQVSKKDGSYTATMWLSFCYLPIVPYDTYRILKPDPGLLPQIFDFDEYIMVKSARLPFDWWQVVTTILSIYGFMVAVIYAAMFLTYEYGTVALGVLAAVLGAGFLVMLIMDDYMLHHSSKHVQDHHEQPHLVPVLKPKPPALPQPKTAPVMEPPQITSPEPAPQSRTIHVTEPGPEIISFHEPVPVHVILAKPIKPRALAKPEPRHEEEIFHKPVPALPSVQPMVVNLAQSTAQALPQGRPLKFDPNKILEWGAQEEMFAQLQQQQSIPDKEGMQVPDWLALLNIIAIGGQVLMEFYFMLHLAQPRWMSEMYGVFEMLSKYSFLSLTGIMLFILTFRRTPVIAYPLIILALLTLFKAQNYLFDYLSGIV